MMGDVRLTRGHKPSSLCMHGMDRDYSRSDFNVNWVVSENQLSVTAKIREIFVR